MIQVLVPRVILGDFAAGLTAAMHKKRAKEINPDAAMTVACQVAQSIHETDPDCVLQLCTWPDQGGFISFRSTERAA